MYIAVCDDQVEELTALTALLEQWQTERRIPLRCRAFRSAGDMLDAARHERFTLYLLDVMMPGIDGMDAAREIRTFDDAVLHFQISSFQNFKLPLPGRMNDISSVQFHGATCFL